MAVGDKIRLGRVLALKQGDNFTVGKPYLEDVNIEAEVLEELRGPKVRQYPAKQHAFCHLLSGCLSNSLAWGQGVAAVVGSCMLQAI